MYNPGRGDPGDRQHENAQSAQFGMAATGNQDTQTSPQNDPHAKSLEARPREPSPIHTTGDGEWITTSGWVDEKTVAGQRK
jgi:hypothetical protein